MASVVPDITRNKPVFLEDYTILIADTLSEKFRIQGKMGDFNEWIFEIEGIKIEENKENDEMTMVIDYNIVQHTLTEDPPTDDPKVMTFVGDCILDLMDKAIKEQKLDIKTREEAFEHRESNTQSTINK